MIYHQLNPTLNIVKNFNKPIILFVHVGKCAGESILRGMNEIFGEKVIIFHYHVFDANKKLLEALDYFSNKSCKLASVVIAMRDPLNRWVSSYNWDLHNMYLSKKRSLSLGFLTYPNVNDLVEGIRNGERTALEFGRFGHMGMGLSWYLPIETHFLLNPENTFLLRTEELDSNFRFFVNQFYNISKIEINKDHVILPRIQHDFKKFYPENTFQKLNNNIEIIKAMNKYLEKDINCTNSIIRRIDNSSYFNQKVNASTR